MAKSEAHISTMANSATAHISIGLDPEDKQLLIEVSERLGELAEGVRTRRLSLTALAQAGSPSGSPRVNQCGSCSQHERIDALEAEIRDRDAVEADLRAQVAQLTAPLANAAMLAALWENLETPPTGYRPSYYAKGLRKALGPTQGTR